MSCSWQLICLDCDDEHPEFHGTTNHKDDLMLSLVEHAGAIAALAPLASDQDVHVDTDCGWVNIPWFAKHLGHKIWPKSEYGNLLKDCPHHVTCDGCGSMHERCCKQAGHAGPCDPGRDMAETKRRMAEPG